MNELRSGRDLNNEMVRLKESEFWLKGNRMSVISSKNR